MTDEAPDGLVAVLRALRDRFGRRFSAHPAVREQHCQALGWLVGQPPDGVVFVEDREDVCFVVTTCAEHRVPVIPFGAGTSLEGQTNAPRGGICVDLSSMNSITRVDVDDMMAVVQPGVTRVQLQRQLRDAGLFFPVDPGADATLGGMASTRASGTTTVRYGTMRDNVLALEVVLPDGRHTRIGTLAKKSSAGYDLTRLFVGAEGTLGVITELALKLYPVPPTITSGVCPFPSVEVAVRTVVLARHHDIDLARIELLDEVSVRAANRYCGLFLPETPHVFVEFHGSTEYVRQQISMFDDVVGDQGGGPLRWSDTLEERNALWKARHDAWWAFHALYLGRVGVPTDVCVPISKLADCIAQTQDDIRVSGLDAPLIGHVGDGNFHLLILIDPADTRLRAQVADFVVRLSERAINMGGTCTGEHGMGQGKAALLRLEHGIGGEVMRTIKAALDPQDIMNPGKIFPD